MFILSRLGGLRKMNGGHTESAHAILCAGAYGGHRHVERRRTSQPVPFDYAQDKPFDYAQDKPFDYASFDRLRTGRTSPSSRSAGLPKPACGRQGRQAQDRIRWGNNGAEGGTRTHTGLRPLRPERSASANSATSALLTSVIPHTLGA